MATTTRELPEAFADWARRKRIEIDPQDAPGQSIWAEWDDLRGALRVSWWEEQKCPQCEQTDRPRHRVTPIAGFASKNWQHGCGMWWEPFSTVVLVGDEIVDDDPEFYLAKLDEALAEVKARQESAVDDVRKRLRKDLSGFLADWTTDEDREDNAGGSEVEPGIWRNRDGKWEAWGYDPTTDAEGECVIVAEDDLATVDAKS